MGPRGVLWLSLRRRGCLGAVWGSIIEFSGKITKNDTITRDNSVVQKLSRTSYLGSGVLQTILLRTHLTPADNDGAVGAGDGPWFPVLSLLLIRPLPAKDSPTAVARRSEY